MEICIQLRVNDAETKLFDHDQYTIQSPARKSENLIETYPYIMQNSG